MSYFKHFVLTLSLISFISCSKHDASNPPEEISKTNQVIGTKTVANFITKESSNNLILRDDAFEKTFLLSTSYISGAPAVSGSSFGNKLVRFEMNDQYVAMFELLDGKLAVSSDSLSTKKLLASFPIVGYDEGYVEIDFLNGFYFLVTQSSWVASDYGQSGTEDSLNPIQMAFMGEGYYTDKHLTFTQYAVINNEPLEVRYSFSIYNPNPNFKPKKSNLNKEVGFFEAPQLIKEGSGEPFYYITKFDTEKPVVFYYTSSTPKDFVEAVIDGVLYWNKAFGKDVLSVEPLPADTKVHMPGYNVIQWLEWDSAGFAYADAHADPLTGELLQAHVYMTSVFAKGSLKEAKKFLTEYDNGVAAFKNRKSHRLTIKGFKSRTQLCQRDFTQTLRLELRKLSEIVTLLDSDTDLSDEEKDKLYLRYAQDAVRDTIAHEIGHTLGLRHNFAASLQNKITPDTYETLKKHYLFNGELPNGIVSSGSVMDYTPGVFSAMIGGHIRNKKEALVYDKMAIEWGYTEKTLFDLDLVPFCTDTLANKNIIDCIRFDAYADVFAGAKKDWEENSSKFGFNLAYRYNFLLSEKYKALSPTTPKMLNDIKNKTLSPTKGATKLISSLFYLLKMANTNSEILEIKRQYPHSMTLVDSEAYKKELKEKKSTKFNELGGLTKLIFGDFSLKQQSSDDQFQLSLISKMSKQYNDAVEKLYAELDSEVRTYLKERGEKYFIAFEKELVLQLVVNLKKLKPHFVDDKLPNGLKSFVQELVFLKNSEVLGVVGEDENQKEVQGFYFDYNGMVFHKKLKKAVKTNLRSELVSLLNTKFYDGKPSFRRAFKPINKEIYEAHEKMLKEITDIKKEEDLSAELFDWCQTEKTLFKALKPKEKPAQSATPASAG
ncbi:MAG: zinc-dependent metalloprotease [Bacteriovoracaceae bacterium]